MSKTKKNYTIIQIPKKMLPVIVKVKIINLINFSIVKFNTTDSSLTIIITLNYTKLVPTYKALKIISKASIQYNIKLKTIQYMIKFKYNTNLIFLTTRGLLTYTELIKYNMSGLLLCKILF